MIGWSITAIGVVATIWSIVATAYWLIRPGETAPDHPKRLILRNDR